MTELNEYSRDELRSLLQKNSDSQYEIERKIRRVDLDEEESMQMLKDDRDALEILSKGWSGEAAEKYMLQSYEENDVFRKQFLNAFSQERDRLQDERKRLQNEEEDILGAMADRDDEEE